MVSKGTTLEDRVYRLEVMFEDMLGKFDVLVEAITALREDMKGMATKEELAEVKADIKIIKAAVTATNQQVHHHETRITTLEVRHAAV